MESAHTNTKLKKHVSFCCSVKSPTTKRPCGEETKTVRSLTPQQIKECNQKNSSKKPLTSLLELLGIEDD